ncbi:MAG: hypothetical protein ACRERC_25245, partial [Candidatus Binatia bacterium]
QDGGKSAMGRTLGLAQPPILSFPRKGGRDHRSQSSDGWSARISIVLAIAIALVASGCSTYTDRLAQASSAASAGDYTAAVNDVNAVMGVSNSDELPNQWSGDRPLAVLERGSLQQALAEYGSSQRDLSGVEPQLELLDMKTDPVAALGSYLYSDSVKTYRTPPTERLALNPVNLLNYLAAGDLDGAAVEARRFQVMREYLTSLDITADGPATLGAYLAGFVFERRGEGDRALRYYEEALAAGPVPSLDAPISRLARIYPYRGPHLSAVLAQQPSAKGQKVDAIPPAELLIVLSVGRVPHKVPERIPVGAAVGIAGALLSNNIDWLKYGAGKVVVYPQLVATPSGLGPAAVTVDGQGVAVEALTDLGASIRQEYEDAKPKIIAAALVRMAARAAVAEGVRAGGKQQSSALGDVLSILVETTMVALDRPDTRSWTMLPDHVLVARLPVAPGTHTVEVSFGGSGSHSIPVDVPAAGFAAVVVTEPR